MIAVGTEGCDEKGGMVIKGIVAGDSEEEVFLNILLLWTPDFLATFVDDGVLMWVIGNSSGTQQGSEEVREEFGFWDK
jgi:hypothetical protein